MAERPYVDFDPKSNGPLGNQSRARRWMYAELAKLRQDANATPHIEPTGEEVFE